MADKPVWVNKTVVDGRTWAQKEGSFQENWWWVEKSEDLASRGNTSAYHIGGWAEVNYLNLEEMTNIGLFVIEMKLKVAKVLAKKVAAADYKRQVKAAAHNAKFSRPTHNTTWFG